ncbi:alpha-1B-glycoprotein [Pteropus vampyrus]|uniref:Alpha-1B-glycoprotein n=1 Tax=Pteropus vampyrus TaxID=132908 RepID=A0A6P6C2T2_PTEVA|nr:alpha-1B-glycoprotein [Pteropus vampyrus]
MSVLVAFLLLWGLSLSPAPEAAIAIETRPNLWAEAESLLEPWANVTLMCQARLETLDFQLFKNGVCQEHVHLDLVTTEHRFPLGAVTGDTRGLYRCRSGMDERWTELSNLLEVNGAESLPPPLLSSEPVSWITPGLTTILVCRGGFRGVTFLLRREGDDQFLEVAEAPEDVQATFPVQRAGNYSCSYRTHAAGAPSEPSAPVVIEELGECLDHAEGFLREVSGGQSWPLPRPQLLPLWRGAVSPGHDAVLRCEGHVPQVTFELLRAGETVATVHGADHSSADLVLTYVGPQHAGNYSCRYRSWWPRPFLSRLSNPVELQVAGS